MQSQWRGRSLAQRTAEVIQVPFQMMREQLRARAKNDKLRVEVAAHAHPGRVFQYSAATPARVHALLLTNQLQVKEVLRCASVAIEDRITNSRHLLAPFILHNACVRF